MLGLQEPVVGRERLSRAKSQLILGHVIDIVVGSRCPSGMCLSRVVYLLGGLPWTATVELIWGCLGAYLEISVMSISWRSGGGARVGIPGRGDGAAVTGMIGSAAQCDGRTGTGQRGPICAKEHFSV